MSEDNSLNLQSLLLWLSIVVIGVTIFMLGMQLGQDAEPTAEAAHNPEKTSLVDVGVDDDPFMGDEDAPIVMIEFSDYQCPYCRSFYNDTLPRIKENFIDKGLVKFVYRDLPLTSLGHTDALPAANAAECAREQGGDSVYFDYHDRIFQGQNELGFGTVKIPGESLYQYAEELGLDMEKFGSCQENLDFEPEIQKDLSVARANGLNGTPSFVINGIVVTGAQAYENFEAAFNKILNQ